MSETGESSRMPSASQEVKRSDTCMEFTSIDPLGGNREKSTRIEPFPYGRNTPVQSNKTIANPDLNGPVWYDEDRVVPQEELFAEKTLAQRKEVLLTKRESNDAKKDCMLRILALLIGHLGILPMTAYYMNAEKFYSILGVINYDITNFACYLVHVLVLLSSIKLLPKIPRQVPAYVGFVLVTISTTLLMLVTNLDNPNKTALVIAVYLAILMISLCYTPTASSITGMLLDANPKIMVWYFAGISSSNSTVSMVHYMTKMIFDESSIYRFYVLCFMIIICHFAAIPLLFKLKEAADLNVKEEHENEEPFSDILMNLGQMYTENYVPSLILTIAFIVLFTSFPSLALYTTMGDSKGPLLFTLFGVVDFLVKIPVCYYTENAKSGMLLLISLACLFAEIGLVVFNVLLFMDKSEYTQILTFAEDKALVALVSYTVTAFFFSITTNIATSLMNRKTITPNLKKYNSIAIPLNIAIGIVLGMTFSATMKNLLEIYLK